VLVGGSWSVVWWWEPGHVVMAAACWHAVGEDGSSDGGSGDEGREQGRSGHGRGGQSVGKGRCQSKMVQQLKLNKRVPGKNEIPNSRYKRRVVIVSFRYSEN
jgi:hypothetical protein